MSCQLRVRSYELRVESLVEIQKCEFKSMSCEFISTSYEYESTCYEFESTSYEFESTSYEFKSISYEFQSTSHEFESTRIIKSMKTQVNSLKSSSFHKIVSPKLFSNSWGNLYIQFFVLRFHYSMAMIESVNINFERRDLNSPQKSHPSSPSKFPSC